MLGSLDENQIEQLLKTQYIGRIGCHSKGITYVVPLSYVYDGSFFYGHSRVGMKLNIMRENPSVCFQVDSIKNMASWESVVVTGSYEEITDINEKRKALNLLNSRILPMVSGMLVKITPEWPFENDDDINQLKGILFKIRPLSKSGRYEKSF